MRRRLFNFAAAMSLVLCVWAVVFSIRSYSRGDMFVYDRAIHTNKGFDRCSLKLLVSAGRVGLSFETRGYSWESLKPRHDISNELYPWHSTLPPNEFRGYGREFLGFAAGKQTSVFGTSYDRYDGSAILVPFWSIVLLTLILPGRWFLGWRRKQARIRAGRCACGYDLTGNTSGVCPECGTLVAGKVEAKA